MSPHELIQLATVLQAQAVPVLIPYAKDSPALLNMVIGVLDDLPRLLEEAYLECDTLNELARETQRNRQCIADQFFGRFCHG
jgi:hypothetical protein